MIRKTATIRNAQGIHCRPSAAIVKEAMKMGSSITLTSDEGSCDACSIMGILSLGLHEGMEVEVAVEGGDEERVAQRMVELLETRFDFPPRDPGDTSELIAQKLRELEK